MHWLYKTLVSCKVQFPLSSPHLFGVHGAMNIRSYQPFCFNRLPTCWPIPISDTSELNWQPNLSCLLSMHNTLPCFLNAFTLSFFCKKTTLKIGISRLCMLDADECLNKLGSPLGSPKIPWFIISFPSLGTPFSDSPSWPCRIDLSQQLDPQKSMHSPISTAEASAVNSSSLDSSINHLAGFCWKFNLARNGGMIYKSYS